ncbi:MAG: carbonic anhydrase [Planctomycetes bacterium]|nr:carbonic anhydrase [Planctomycetota bacterium]
MNTIDYVYRFDPKNPSVKLLPADAEEAKRRLEEGNGLFASWMQSCRDQDCAGDIEPRYVVQCNGLEVGMVRNECEMPKQSPFAVVIGCSDARVPTEMIFGQGFNDLFVIRVAGNVLGDECLGSIGFALNVLSDSVRVMVMLGHTGCGAVTGAVEAYLQPQRFWSRSTPLMLRSILQRLFVPVREAANGLKTVWGQNARNMPGYREALIQSAVCMNAAQTAYDLRLEVERSGKFDIEVLFGVFSFLSHHVSTPAYLRNYLSSGGAATGLAYAMTNPRDFTVMSQKLAEELLVTMGPKRQDAPQANAISHAGNGTGANGAHQSRRRTKGNSRG